MDDPRPDPDALLRRVNAASAPPRGRLKVFFGAAPGVGKTYAMLAAARQRRAEGVEVVVGWLETHGRAETDALAQGLERLPARRYQHRGVTLEEFDLDAALARRPGLLLLDELAHSNAPGARHAKRWQDALELRAAGIDVFTTLNVQHIESLNDRVQQITGVLVRETVPDRLLDEADQVEFVDLPPEELEQRLQAGKVYLPERAGEAARGFFRRGNLLALRELALRRTAEHVDADVLDYRRDHEIGATWPVAERILVAVRPNPDSERLVRAARRLASRLKADWIVAYVEASSQPALSAGERQALSRTLTLAEDLGATTASLAGDEVAEVLLDFARRRNVTRLVVGKPAHARWRDRLRGSLLDRIVRGSGAIEVHVLSGGQATHAHASPLEPRVRARAAYVTALAVVAGCTLVCWPLFGRFDSSNLVMVYLSGVAFVAARHGRRPSALAALLAVAAFDFFFVPPHLTFAVEDTQYLVTFAVMLTVGLLISTLAERVRAQADAARRREERTQILYAVSRDLAAARSADDVRAAVVRHVGAALRGTADLLLPGPDGRLTPATQAVDGARELAVAQWAFDHVSLAGLGTDTLPSAAAVYVPLQGTRAPVGVLVVSPDPGALPLAPEQLDLLQALARQAASAVERARLAADADQARLAVEAERLRSTLLASVSHDLRTPLSAITGAASSLLDPGTLDALGERELKEAIRDEAERLNRLVTNLLDMTRLESGALRLTRDWHSLEELVGSALRRLESTLAQRRVDLSLPPDLPLVPVDGLLIEQVLVNLLDNAAKYTPAGTPLAVSARVRDDGLEVEVADEGPGIPDAARELVFEKFHRGDTGARGFGLGLPICRAILAAHGGRIRAEARQPHGARLCFTLPLGQPPPAIEDEA
jgi:two-component system sensor histidine kinase KdpD